MAPWSGVRRVQAEAYWWFRPQMDRPLVTSIAIMMYGLALAMGGGDFTARNGYVYFVEAKSGRIYRQPTHTGTAKPITLAFGSSASPTVSPDGKYLLYVHTYERDDCIAVVDTEGKSWPQKLISGDDFYMQPCLAPRWSAYCLDRLESPSDALGWAPSFCMRRLQDLRMVCSNSGKSSRLPVVKILLSSARNSHPMDAIWLMSLILMAGGSFMCMISIIKNILCLLVVKLSTDHQHGCRDCAPSILLQMVNQFTSYKTEMDLWDYGRWISRPNYRNEYELARNITGWRK